MRTGVAAILIGLVLFLGASSSAQGQRRAEAAGRQSSVVLDTMGFWRMHNTLKPPVIQADGGLKPHVTGLSWLDAETEPPAADWRDPAFDDRGWVRGPARAACSTPYLARLCLRGKFQVTNPSQVRGLTLSATYHGGVIVYLNGKEVGRKDVPAGAVGAAALAGPYPLDVYVDAEGHLLADDGTYIADGRRAGRPTADAAQRMAMRARKLEGMAVPTNLLRKGVNVLAVEVVRAPWHKVMLEKDGQGGKRRRNKFDWNTCQIDAVQLTAAEAGGLEPNAVRPQGLQVWNGDSMAADTDLDWGDPCEPLRPIELAIPRNGRVSGKMVVGSTSPLRGLKAVPSDLKGDEGKIPAANVHVRYGLPWGVEVGTNRGDGQFNVPYAEYPNLLGLVAENPPAEVKVREVRSPQCGGAVVPIWVTVTVPRDALPGIYSGQLSIRAGGDKMISVVLRVNVLDYMLPDPQDYRTWVELIEVPDTLAVEYDVPLWSDRHFSMIARAFDAMSDSGSRVVYVPAIAHTNLGNAESMIRWIPKGGGRYDWDFSVMDKYLDLALEHLGKPKIVCLQVWEVYMSSRQSAGKRMAELGIQSGPQVTLLDRATGKTKNTTLPRLTDPSSKAVWQALLAQVRKHLRERGIEKTLMLGVFTDAVPTKEDVQFFKDLAPDLAWVHQGHGLFEQNQKLYGIGELGYQATVWGAKFSDGVQTHGTTHKERMQGWNRNILVADFERNTGVDTHPTTRWRLFGETNITGMQRGMGRIGADYWQAVRDSRGRRVGWMHERFADGAWGTGGSMNLNLCNPVLGPGPDGPEATRRLLALAEGVQECEARILIERALSDEALRARLGADLAKRCDALLDERDLAMWKGLSNHMLGGPHFFGATAWRWAPGIAGHTWFLGSGWQERTEKLYRLAGEVQKKLTRR